MNNTPNKSGLYAMPKANGYTPRQLINFHINHPEQPITDNDINNLIFSSDVESILLSKNTTKSTAAFEDSAKN